MGIYGAQGDWGRAAEAYETGFREAPLLARDKKVLKAYRKACKKAGRQPVS